MTPPEPAAEAVRFSQERASAQGMTTMRCPRLQSHCPLWSRSGLGSAQQGTSGGDPPSTPVVHRRSHGCTRRSSSGASACIGRLHTPSTARASHADSPRSRNGTASCVPARPHTHSPLWGADTGWRTWRCGHRGTRSTHSIRTPQSRMDSDGHNRSSGRTRRSACKCANRTQHRAHHRAGQP